METRTETERILQFVKQLLLAPRWFALFVPFADATVSWIRFNIGAGNFDSPIRVESRFCPQSLERLLSNENRPGAGKTQSEHFPGNGVRVSPPGSEVLSGSIKPSIINRADPGLIVGMQEIRWM